MSARSTEAAKPPRRGSSGPLVFVIACFALGIGGAYVWKSTRQGPPASDGESSPTAGAAEAPGRPNAPPSQAARLAAEELFQRGYALFGEERFGEAIAFFERATKIDPTDARPHHGIGLSSRRLFLLERAEEAFRRAIELEPGLADAKKELLTLLHDAGRFEEALKLAEELSAAFPESNFYRAEIAINLMQLGQLERAIGLLADYNRAEGAQAWGHAQLARALHLHGDTTAAELEYRQALALDARSPLALFWYGQLLAETERSEEAKPILERYRRLRQLQNDEQQISLVLQQRPDHIPSLVRLAQTRFEQGKRREALAVLDRARRVAPEDRALEQLWRKVAGAVRAEDEGQNGDAGPGPPR